jgi:uncharacterized protein YidB (DUF937 family)
MGDVDDTRRRRTEGIRTMSTNNSTNQSTNTAQAGGRRGLTIGLAGGLLAGTAAGLVFGVPGLSSAASDMTPAAVAQQTDDPETTDPTGAAEMGTRLRESLQELVDDGAITAEQADAVAAHLAANRAERGEGGPGRRHGGLGMFGRGVASEALTDLLGLDAAALRTQLRDGATLAEIAADQGVEVQAVVDELVAEVAERVDNAVANGRIDQAQADEKLAEAEARITDMVENGRPGRGDAAD